jgi:hypothetical protein
MAKTLLEAAADMLAQSKRNAPAMPLEKVKAEVDDLGGPTPQNWKPTDDSSKIDASKGIKKQAQAPETKPSGASSDTQLKMNTANKPVREEEETNEEETISEDINDIFNSEENLSEEFKQKVSVIFEARVADKFNSLKEELENSYATQLQEAIESINNDLTDKVNDYLDYVVEQWMEENQVAIESGLRSELVEDFIGGLRNLFAEHYIDVPEEKVDLVDELATQVESLEAKLDEEIQRGMEYKKQLVESKKAEVLYTVCDGLTDVQAEKIRSLAESVEFSTEEEYKENLETIRENYFPSGIKKATEASLNEQVEDEGKQVIADPVMKAYADTIRKTIPR